jgi:hypothetical protein
MPKTSRNARIGSAYRDFLHRTKLQDDVPGQKTRPQRTGLTSPLMWIAPLLIGTVGAFICYEFRVAIASWSLVASSALGNMLPAILLTIGVCGSIASAVIWWVFQQELRANRNHREEMREYLAAHGTQESEPDQRQAA